MIWQPTTQDTIRLAGFRYLLPQVQGRLHPTHSAGIFITRNTEEGALVEELNLVWERNWNGGILRSNLFDLERRNREQRQINGPETLERSSLRGASIGVNQQLGNRFGIAANLALSEIRDDQPLLQTERDEVNASVVLSYISPRRISAQASQSFRQIDFLESGLDTENISITDIELGYTFADRRGSISLSVNNLFDEEFVAVVDSFTFNRFRPEREYRATLSWNF